MSKISPLLNGAFPDLDALPELLENVFDSLVMVQSKRFGAGAGVLWSEDGLVLTNNHVLGKYVPKVTLNDGQTFEAEVLNIDTDADLAVLKIDAKNLPAAAIADSDKIRIGELAFAVGHPWGQRNSVTAGVISQVSTIQTESGRKFPIIRTDSRLAPGNSGGPLINAAGEVMGINTMIVGGDQGIAISASVAQALVDKPKRARTDPELNDDRGMVI